MVRPVVFLAYSGEARWRTARARNIAARLGEPLTARADRPARGAPRWTPAGEWMPAVLAAADTRLQQKRQHVPDAGGTGHRLRSDHRRARTPDLLHQITGEVPTVVLSDDPAVLGPHQPSSPRATSRWLVAVRMVSEGVDVPRLAVGVYADQRVDTAVLRPGDRPVRPARRSR